MNRLYKKRSIVFNATSGLLLVLFLTLSGIENAVAQEADNFKEFKGVVINARSKKSLEFATLSVTNTNISSVSNVDGEFSLKVPTESLGESVLISYLGFKSLSMPISDLKEEGNRIEMLESFEKLPDVNIADVDPYLVMKRAMENRSQNTVSEPLIVEAFYRESIKKRRTYASLSEAVVDIYRSPFAAESKDYATLVKARKSTDYNKIDTLVIKLQGGPYNNIGMDMVRNRDLFFSSDMFDIYKFRFDKMVNMNNKNVYVIDFEQKGSIVEPFYKGKLYVDADSYALVKTEFSLNLANLVKAKRFFVKKKPFNADVIPLDTKYIVDYRELNGKWYFNYSRIELSFKIKWDKKLFNSIYNISIEMAVTDWKVNEEKKVVRSRDRMRRNVILTDQASGFSDPRFWGERNVIEPDKSIDNAIRKIQRSFKRNSP
jgi:hypothetical protein